MTNYEIFREKVEDLSTKISFDLVRYATFGQDAKELNQNGFQISFRTKKINDTKFSKYLMKSGINAYKTFIKQAKLNNLKFSEQTENFHTVISILLSELGIKEVKNDNL